MTRIYGYNETLEALMPEADELSHLYGSQQPGFIEGQVLPNPYYEADESYREDWLSPVGLVLTYLGVDVRHLEDMSSKHMRLCDDTECEICEEGADNSIYTQWVRQWLSEEYDIAFTEEALDILWEAETSGLTLAEWLEQAKLRNEL